MLPQAKQNGELAVSAYSASVSRIAVVISIVLAACGSGDSLTNPIDERQLLGTHQAVAINGQTGPVVLSTETVSFEERVDGRQVTSQAECIERVVAAEIEFSVDRLFRARYDVVLECRRVGNGQVVWTDDYHTDYRGGYVAGDTGITFVRDNYILDADAWNRDGQLSLRGPLGGSIVATVDFVRVQR